MKNIKSFGEFINEASSRDISNTTKVNEMEEYMFFNNLKTIKSRVDEMLAMDPTQVETLLKDGHAWAIDHIATSKDDVEEVADFLKNNVK